MSQRIQLHQLVGDRVRALRQAAGRRQEDLAAAAREYGFDWVRGTVASIEAGQRRVTLEEFLALPTILTRTVGYLRSGDPLVVGLRDLVTAVAMVTRS